MNLLITFFAFIAGIFIGVIFIISLNVPIPAFAISMAVKECESNHGLKAIQKHIIPHNSYTFFCRNTARFVNVSFSPLLLTVDETQKDGSEKETKLSK